MFGVVVKRSRMPWEPARHSNQMLPGPWEAPSDFCRSGRARRARCYRCYIPGRLRQVDRRVHGDAGRTSRKRRRRKVASGDGVGVGCAWCCRNSPEAHCGVRLQNLRGLNSRWGSLRGVAHASNRADGETDRGERHQRHGCEGFFRSKRSQRNEKRSKRCKRCQRKKGRQGGKEGHMSLFGQGPSIRPIDFLKAWFRWSLEFCSASITKPELARSPILTVNFEAKRHEKMRNTCELLS